MLIDCSSHPNFDGHEEVHKFEDEETGLSAFIAIHRSGALGVAGGGCRMWPYEREEDALRDVLRLSQDMTYKLALAGLGAGGAKCVVIGDSRTHKTQTLLSKLGAKIHSLQGRFVVGGDVGTNSEDLKVIARSTPYVELGSYGRDTVSEATAGGVYWAIVAALSHVRPGVELKNTSVAIQGMGKVGARLAELLFQDGVSLVVSDVDERRAQQVADRLGARNVAPTQILSSEVDVFAPCALGDILTEESVLQLRCRAVAGSANNQLKHPGVSSLLQSRGIAYVPDFVANMGGTLAGAKPHACHSQESVRSLTAQVFDITRSILTVAEDSKVLPRDAALELARKQVAVLSEKNQAVRPWFHRLWRIPQLARFALRMRTWVEELRGRWAQNRDFQQLPSRAR